MFLDDWQQWLLDQMLSEDENARWLASVILIIIPRQNGKNAVLEALELYAFYVLGESRILHTAHLAKTAADHMRRMVQLVRANPELDKITTIYWANGKEALVRKDTDARLEFITRGKGTSRGGSPSRVVFDEALFLNDEQINAILPSLSAQSMNDDPPQMIYTSSAPLPESDVLHRIRDAGIAGSAERMFFAEWSIPEAIDLTDDLMLTAALLQANPGMGVRISERWVRNNELVQMSIEGFLTERLGVVPKGSASRIIGADVYAAAGDVLPVPEVGRRALVWDVSPDSSWSSVGWVGERADGVLHGEIVESAAGTSWVAERLARYATGAGPLVVAVGYVGSTPAEALVSDVVAAFKAAGLTLEDGKDGNLIKVSGSSFAAGCVEWFNKTTAGTLRHIRQAWLTSAVDGAVWRNTGETRVWDRKNATSEITPLCCVTAGLKVLEAAPVLVSKPVFWA